MRAAASCEAWARSRVSPSPTERFTPIGSRICLTGVVKFDEGLRQLEGDEAVYETPQLGSYARRGPVVLPCPSSPAERTLLPRERKRLGRPATDRSNELLNRATGR